MNDSLNSIRAQLARALDWEDAHVGFDAAVDGIPVDRRGAHAPGFPHACWQLLEHMRITQHDLLDFCLNSHYVHALTWPDDYWPSETAPTPDAWDASLAAFTTDRQALKQLVRDLSVDLSATVPAGKGNQTYLRSVLLVVDHSAYHLGQLVAVRQALGVWK
jgi:uncharacterized damage-inducible protein DinB